MPLPMSAVHLAEQRGRYEPQRSYCGHVTVLGVPGWERGDSDVTLAVQSFALPKEESEVLSALFGNCTHHFPGVNNVEAIQVVIRDFVDVPVAQALLRWRRAVYDPMGRLSQEADLHTGLDSPLSGRHDGGLVGLPGIFKKEARLELWAPDGEDSRVWSLFGVWPSRMDFGGVDMETAGVVTITAVLQADDILTLPSDLNWV